MSRFPVTSRADVARFTTATVVTPPRKTASAIGAPTVPIRFTAVVTAVHCRHLSRTTCGVLTIAATDWSTRMAQPTLSATVLTFTSPLSTWSRPTRIE